MSAHASPASPPVPAASSNGAAASAPPPPDAPPSNGPAALPSQLATRNSQLTFAHGEVSVTFQPTIFKKIKFDTHENIGWGKIHLPEEELQTTAFWVALPDSRTSGLPKEEIEGGLVGLASLLGAVAPLYLMCDPHDVGVVPQVKSPFTGLPTVFIYERVPAGVGFAERLFAMCHDLLKAAAEVAQRCTCDSGCPSCVGPAGIVGEKGKLGSIHLALGPDVASGAASVGTVAPNAIGSDGTTDAAPH